MSVEWHFLVTLNEQLRPLKGLGRDPGSRRPPDRWPPPRQPRQLRAHRWRRVRHQRIWTEL